MSISVTLPCYTVCLGKEHCSFCHQRNDPKLCLGESVMETWLCCVGFVVGPHPCPQCRDVPCASVPAFWIQDHSKNTSWLCSCLRRSPGSKSAALGQDGVLAPSGLMCNFHI